MKDDTSYHTTNRSVEVAAPPLDALIAYRGVYVLCTVDAKNKNLKATHYAAVLSAGPAPIWGVWSINGVFQRFFTFRKTVAAAYPRLVWRRMQATWSLVSMHERDEASRMRQLRRLYKSHKPLTGGEVRQVREEDQMELFPAKENDDTNVVHMRK